MGRFYISSDIAGMDIYYKVIFNNLFSTIGMWSGQF